MASIRQIHANRQNSARSTGPSEEGKLASRMNALKHGMAAQEVTFEDDAERIQTKVAEWLAELKPEGPFQLQQVEHIAAATVLIERCQNEENDLRYRLASRTDDARNLDLSIEADRVAAGLPRQPARVSMCLQQTVQGNDWLLARLRLLKNAIGGTREDGSPLRPLAGENRSLALDILGVAPVLRTDQTVLDPPAGVETGTEADLAAHQARVIDERIARLERFKDQDLAEAEAIDRDANAMGRDIKISQGIRLIRRYKKDAQRALEHAQAELQRLKDIAKEEQAAARKARRFALEMADYDTPVLPSAGSEEAVSPASASAAAPAPAAPAMPEPSRPSSVTECGFRAAAAAAALAAEAAAPEVDKGHEEFEAALLEAFPPDESRRNGKGGRDHRAARAAHKGFPS